MTQHKLFKINQEEKNFMQHAKGRRPELPKLIFPEDRIYHLEKLLDEGVITVRTNFEMRKRK